ncbi:MAG: cytochrome c biogenesis protein CcdA [Bacillota bacterium]
MEADLNILIAFTAGLLSFFSPCVLPLLPAYLGALGALAFPGAKGANAAAPGRNRVLLPALAFICGFAVIFIVMGLAAGLLGRALLAYRELIYRLGGIVIIFFALVQLNVLKFSFLLRSWRLVSRVPAAGGFISAMLMGAVFSAGWSPCVGPVLGGILLLAMVASSTLQAAYYLVAYTAGMAVPFFLVALFLEGFMLKRGKLNRYLPFFTRLSGLLLLLLGILLVSGLFLRLTAMLTF